MAKLRTYVWVDGFRWGPVDGTLPAKVARRIDNPNVWEDGTTLDDVDEGNATAEDEDEDEGAVAGGDDTPPAATSEDEGATAPSSSPAPAAASSPPRKRRGRS